MEPKLYEHLNENGGQLSQIPERGAVRTEDLEYQRYGGRPILARIYHPSGAGPFPAIIEVHGGAWISNDRLANASFMEELAARGTLVVSIDFRMPPEAAYPASLIDINTAIRWLKGKATELNIEPSRIGALGTSSGGHQVLLTGLRPNHPRYLQSLDLRPDADASLAFVIACWPIVDPVQRYTMAKANNREDLVRAHELFWGSEEAMDEGSPQSILNRNEQTHTPRTLLIQGTGDENVDHRTMEPFAESYQRRGGSIQVHKFEGARHAFIRHDQNTPAAVEAIDLVDRFIHDDRAARHR